MSAAKSKTPGTRDRARQQACIRAEQQQRRQRMKLIGAGGIAAVLLILGIFSVVSIQRAPEYQRRGQGGPAS